MATDVISVTAPLDPCGYVFAPENKAAGGTTLEWAHYRLCQIENALVSAPQEIWSSFKDELAYLWNSVEQGATHVYQWLGNNIILPIGNAVQDLGRRVGQALGMVLPGMERWGLYILIGVGALAAIWLTEK